MTTLLTDSPRTRINIPYKPRKWARPMHDSFCRWMCLVLHRRAGKTVATINHLQRAVTNDAWERRRLRALEPSLSDRHVTDLLRDRFYGHVLPTYRLAEVTVWAMLKYYGERVPGVVFNEQKLRVTYPNGSRLQLFGADNPDRSAVSASLGWHSTSTASTRRTSLRRRTRPRRCSARPSQTTGS